MRVAAFAGVGRPLRIETRPDPVPGEQQVVIKVLRCGICGTDLHMTSEHYSQPHIGLIPGHEVAGEIVALGKGVTQFVVGDAVTCLPFIGCGRCAACLVRQPAWCEQPRGTGLLEGFAEYVLAGAPETVRLAGGLSMQDGALVEPLAVGLHGVALAQMTPGARVLVHGPGPIGLAVIYWARRLGAGRIVALGSSNRRQAFARAMGAEEFVIDGADAEQLIRDSLGGLPDVVFESVGRPGAIERSIAFVKPRGKVVSLGFCTDPDTLVPAHAMIKEVSLQFSCTYGVADFEYCIDALDAGAVEPSMMVTRTVSLDELPAAFEALRQPGPDCKVMVDPWLRD